MPRWTPPSARCAPKLRLLPYTLSRDTTKRFKEAQNAFAEDNYRTTFPALPHWNAALWANFPFRGIARIDSKVCYLKHRSELHW